MPVPDGPFISRRGAGVGAGAGLGAGGALAVTVLVGTGIGAGGGIVGTFTVPDMKLIRPLRGLLEAG